MIPWPKDPHEVEERLKKHFRVSGDYEVNDDLSVTVNGSVKFFTDRALTRLPVRFRKVLGNFSVNDSWLETLDGSPLSVGGSFKAQNCELNSLEHSPREVGETFDVSTNHLTSLAHGPERVGESYDCSNNRLRSPHRLPTVVPKDLRLEKNPFEDLKGLPMKVGGALHVTYKSDLPMLSIALVDFDALILHDEASNPKDRSSRMPSCMQVTKIFKAHRGEGRRGVIAVSNDLIDAGYTENAKF